VEIEKILSKYSYADVRIERSKDVLVKIQDNEIKVSSGESKGVSVRVLEKGSWGFAASNRIESISELLKQAAKLAALEKGDIKLKTASPARRKITKAIQIVHPDEQVKHLLDAGKEMSGKGIVSRRINCTDSIMETEFYNSEGSELIQKTGYSYVSCISVAKDGIDILRGVETCGSRKGFGSLELHKTARISREKAQRLLGAPVAPKGRFTVVLDPEMTGVFAHEAVGHASEADSIVDRESILTGRIGKKIGNELVTIADDPTADDFGAYEFDDEGVKARKTTIIEGGVLRNFINSRETAFKTKSAPNGHARAGSYDSLPIVRMSNTYFSRGKHSMEDVFDVKSGIYLKGMKGGSVDIFSGGFMFKAEEAYEIKNGEYGKVLRDATLSGNILSTLRNVSAVGKDFGTSPGICGKMGQEAPVSDGGPHIKVEDMMVG